VKRGDEKDSDSEDYPPENTCVSRFLRFLISLTLFIAAFGFFCGPIVIKTGHRVKIPGYPVFAAVCVLLWLIRLICISIKKCPGDHGVNSLTSAAEAFGRRPLLASIVLIFISTALRFKELQAAFKPIMTRHLLLDDRLLTTMPFLNIIIAKLSMIIVVFAIFKLVDRLSGKVPALAAAVLVAAFPFNNSNYGFFYVETSFCALCTVSLYFLFSEKRPHIHIGMALFTVASVLHPAGYILGLPAAGFLMVRRKPSALPWKRAYIPVVAALALSVIWYAVLQQSLLDLLGSRREWRGYEFSIFLPLMGRLFKNKAVILLICVGAILAVQALAGKRSSEKSQVIYLLAAAGLTTAWWTIEHNDFSLSALAVAMPMLLIVGAYPLTALNTRRFFTKTLFDRNVAVLLTAMAVAYLTVMYDFEKTMRATADYSIFEMHPFRKRDKIVPDEDAELGYSIAFKKSRKGILMFGPYYYMLPGEYEVRFRLRPGRIEQGEGTCHVGDIEVRSDGGHDLIAELQVEFGNEYAGDYREFVLPFELDRMEEVEFCLSGNQKADIYLDNVHVLRKSGASEKTAFPFSPRGLENE
jgi:hypothetical protein